MDEIMIIPNDALRDELKLELEEIRNLPAGSEERARAIEDFTKLFNARANENKILWENQERVDKLEADELAAEADRKEHAKDRWSRVGMWAVNLVAAIGIGMIGFRFEETGSLRSSVFRGLSDHFRRDTEKP